MRFPFVVIRHSEKHGSVLVTADRLSPDELREYLGQSEFTRFDTDGSCFLNLMQQPLGTDAAGFERLFEGTTTIYVTLPLETRFHNLPTDLWLHLEHTIIETHACDVFTEGLRKDGRRRPIDYLWQVLELTVDELMQYEGCTEPMVTEIRGWLPEGTELGQKLLPVRWPKNTNAES